MSRAFVKEIDDASLPSVERPVSTAPNLVTPRGAQLIEKSVATLEEQLAATPDEEAASVLRRDLRYWVARRASMRIVTPNVAPNAIGFGVRATIRRGALTSDISIVGEDEADPTAGLIAWTAPLARALDGAEPGDIVDLEAGGRLEPILVVAATAGGVE